MNVTEAAAWLTDAGLRTKDGRPIDKHVVYRRIGSGALHATMRGNSYEIAVEDLQEYVANGGNERPPVDAPPLLTVAEAARALRFSQETVRRMCTGGRLPFIRPPGRNSHIRIPAAAVHAYLDPTRGSAA